MKKPRSARVLDIALGDAGTVVDLVEESSRGYRPMPETEAVDRRSRLRRDAWERFVQGGRP